MFDVPTSELKAPKVAGDRWTDRTNDDGAMHRDRAVELDAFLAAIERRALVMSELATKDREEALDLVQDAMLAFARRYAAKPPGDWKPLFYRVLENKIRDWYRRRQARGRWLTRLPTHQPTGATEDPIQAYPDPTARLPEDLVTQDAAMQTLLGAVGELPQRQRQAVLLRLWEGLDVAATATAMGCSAGSVKTHLSRGLASLRECLGDYR